MDKYFGSNIEKETYPARVEAATRWDSKVRWHTMFPWWASDVTFFGAVLLVFFFSYSFALAWKDSILMRNPFAISLSLQFVTLFTYMSANDQVPFKVARQWLDFGSLLFFGLKRGERCVEENGL